MQFMIKKKNHMARSFEIDYWALFHKERLIFIEGYYPTEIIQMKRQPRTNQFGLGDILEDNQSPLQKKKDNIRSYSFFKK